MLQPGLDERERRALGLQPGVEVLHERGRQRHVGVGELREHVDEALGLFLGRREHAVGPGDGHVPLLAAAGDARRHAADVLEQSQPQHDRESPQLPQVQRIDGLVGGQERRRVVPVDAAVLVGDQVEGQVVDARETRRGAAGQSRQLPAVAAGQVPAGQGDLLLDEVEVVEQPGLCRHDRAARRRPPR